MLTGAVKPAVIGDIEQEVDRRRRAAGSNVLAGQIGVGIFVTDDHAEVVSIQGEAGEAFAGADAVIEIIRCKSIHPGQPLPQRHIFAEGDAVHLVIMTGIAAVFVDQEGGIITVRASICCQKSSVHSQQQRRLPMCGENAG